MTRLALACLGTGYLLGVATIALLGQVTCASLGFSAGIALTVLVLTLTGLSLVWVGYKLGWLQHFQAEHSQSGGD